MLVVGASLSFSFFALLKQVVPQVSKGGAGKKKKKNSCHKELADLNDMNLLLKKT